MNKKHRLIAITFDVEEFDMPLEYGQDICMEEQMKVGFNGLKSLLPILQQRNRECTLFTTANFANNYSQTIKELSTQHEIASHTYYHSTFKNEDLLASRLALESIIQKPVLGLRMPRMRSVEISEVVKAGFVYDSSINPCYLPGKYNNTHLSQIIYKQDSLPRIPATVTPFFRIPLFWLAFKNMPYFVFKRLAIQSLKKYGYLNLYFHPWEFIDLGNYKVPQFTKRYSKDVLLERLYCLFDDLSKEGELVGLYKVLQVYGN